jgi:hypothetical protein
VILPDPIDHSIYILIGLDLDERAPVFLHARESMEILYEMFACLHHTVASLHLPEEITMFSHSREDLIESWLVVPREETPRVAETCSPYHKSIQILVHLSFLWRQESSGSWLYSIPGQARDDRNSILRMYHLRDPILI